MCIWLLEFGSCSIFGKPMCYHATNLGLIPCGGQTVRSTIFFTLLGNTALYDLPDDVICNIAVYADDTTLFSKRSNAPDSWQQLELAYGLESDLRDTGLG